MKNKIEMNETATNSWLATFTIVLSPLIPLIILVFIAAIIDAVLYKKALKVLGKIDEISTKKFWKGIFKKTILYSTVITLFFVVEKLLGNHLLAYFEAERFYLLPTRLAATILIWHEVKSVDKNYITAYGVSFIKKAKDFVNDLISIKEKADNLK
jgi:hypothetical protein